MSSPTDVTIQLFSRIPRFGGTINCTLTQASLADLPRPPNARMGIAELRIKKAIVSCLQRLGLLSHRTHSLSPSMPGRSTCVVRVGSTRWLLNTKPSFEAPHCPQLHGNSDRHRLRDSIHIAATGTMTDSNFDSRPRLAIASLKLIPKSMRQAISSTPISLSRSAC